MRKLLLLGLLLMHASVQAQTSPSEIKDADADAQEAPDVHAELRELRDRIIASYEKRDFEALLKDLDPQVVITWQNATRNEGHDEFRAFYNEMMSGESKIVQDVSSHVEVDDLSILHGDDTAVARGTLADHFVLTDGSNFELNSKWTATVVRMPDAWKIASFHVSANIFDNPILGVAQRWLVTVGLIAGGIGLLVGIVVGRRTKKTK